MKYTVEYENGQAESGLTKIEAVLKAKNSTNTFISWFRKTDLQKGFLNPNGNHEITGIIWNKDTDREFENYLEDEKEE